jgi:hypothetical protein
MAAAAWLRWWRQLGGSSGSAAAVVVGSSGSGISAGNSTIFCVRVGWERGKSSSSDNGSGAGNSAIVCSNMIRRGGIRHGTSNHGRGGVNIFDDLDERCWVLVLLCDGRGGLIPTPVEMYLIST